MDIPRRVLGALGLGLLGIAAVLGVVALQHMRTIAAYGVICGGAPHCAACPASLAALVIGLALLAIAAAPRRRPVLLKD